MHPRPCRCAAATGRGLRRRAAGADQRADRLLVELPHAPGIATVHRRGRRPGLRRRPAGCGASGSSRSISCISSVPATPSTMQWWTLEMMAQRSPSRPSTSHSSHSGLAMVEALAEHPAGQVAQLLVAARRGTAVCRTWYRIWKCGSSTHTGGPVQRHGAPAAGSAAPGSLLGSSRTTSP